VRRFRRGRVRHDPSAPGGAASEHTMGLHEVRTRRRDQGCKPLDELKRGERHSGGRALSGAIRYYQTGGRSAELTTALNAIVESANDCAFPLETPPPADVRVTFDGNGVASADSVLPDTALVFSGSACDQIQSGVVANIRVEDVCAN
jgi:hypothetical protein